MTPTDRRWSDADRELAALPGFEDGARDEHEEYRVVVHPDEPRPTQWEFSTSASNPFGAAAEFGVPTRVECRTIVTYTGQWREVCRG